MDFFAAEKRQASLLLRRSQLARLVDSISFSASISACHKSGQWQEAGLPLGPTWWRPPGLCGYLPHDWNIFC